MDNKELQGPDILVLKFADSKIPVFKETRGKDYIKYGDDNLYPEYLTFLFNKSAKHNAIINGKANYIFGNGYQNGDIIINRNSETLNDISKKAILDKVIYGGYRLEIVWAVNGKIAEIFHVDYNTLRKAKDGGFYWKETWQEFNRDEARYIPSFNPKDTTTSQIFECNDYRPGVRFYPLPEYIGCNNYIETDIEISKYYLSAIRNGMMPSKMVQFYQGEPTDEKKKEIERRFSQKFAGAENAGRFIMVFNSTKDKQVDISDLSATELDKQFEQLNKTCQQEIFSGHFITNPSLFGIKTEGQLGNTNELATSYAIFKNTYSDIKANEFDRDINWLLGYSLWPGEYKLQPTDPVGWQLPESSIEKVITNDEIRERLGLPIAEKTIPTEADKTLNALSGLSPLVANKVLDSMSKNQILGLVGLPPVAGGEMVPSPDGSAQPVPGVTTTAATDMPVNDSIKNLTAKQHQQLTRIIRQYSKGQLTELAAKALLKTGLNITGQEANDLLGIESVLPLAASFEEQEDAIIGMFDECGDSKSDYEILKSKRVSFSAIEDMAEDEDVYKQAFIAYNDITTTESKIIELIKKDPRITPDVIAKAIGESVKYVTSKIELLTKKGYLDISTEVVGSDVITIRKVPEGVGVTPPPSKGKANPTQIFIKYSYEGPQDSKNRPFCAKMMQLNRLYSRFEIEKISQRLGYSVFDRRGGFWTEKGTDITHPYCRHNWRSNILVKKGGENVN